MSRKLANQTTRYANQTQQWLTLVDGFNMSLKVQDEQEAHNLSFTF